MPRVPQQWAFGLRHTNLQLISHIFYDSLRHNLFTGGCKKRIKQNIWDTKNCKKLKIIPKIIRVLLQEIRSRLVWGGRGVFCGRIFIANGLLIAVNNTFSSIKLIFSDGCDVDIPIKFRRYASHILLFCWCGTKIKFKVFLLFKIKFVIDSSWKHFTISFDICISCALLKNFE